MLLLRLGMRMVLVRHIAASRTASISAGASAGTDTRTARGSSVAMRMSMLELVWCRWL